MVCASKPDQWFLLVSILSGGSILLHDTITVRVYEVGKLKEFVKNGLEGILCCGTIPAAIILMELFLPGSLFYFSELFTFYTLILILVVCFASAFVYAATVSYLEEKTKPHIETVDRGCLLLGAAVGATLLGVLVGGPLLLLQATLPGSEVVMLLTFAVILATVISLYGLALIYLKPAISLIRRGSPE